MIVYRITAEDAVDVVHALPSAWMSTATSDRIELAALTVPPVSRKSNQTLNAPMGLHAVDVQAA